MGKSAFESTTFHSNGFRSYIHYSPFSHHTECVFGNLHFFLSLFLILTNTFLLPFGGIKNPLKFPLGMIFVCSEFVACFVLEAFRECRVKVLAYVVSATEFHFMFYFEGGKWRRGGMDMKLCRLMNLRRQCDNSFTSTTTNLLTPFFEKNENRIHNFALKFALQWAFLMSTEANFLKKQEREKQNISLVLLRTEYIE